MKRLLLISVFAFVFFAAPVTHADSIAFDNASSSNATASSLTYSLTVGSGSNRMLWTSVAFLDNSGTDFVTGITYNGTAMTRSASVRPTFTNAYQCYLYYLFAPSTGANNVVVSLSGSKTIYSSSAAYTGAAQSGAPDFSTHSQANVANISTSTNVTTANSWLISTFGDGQNGTATKGTGLSATRGPGVFEGVLADSNAAVSAGANTTQWVNATSPTADADFCMITAAFAPAPAVTNVLFQNNFIW